LVHRRHFPAGPGTVQRVLRTFAFHGQIQLGEENGWPNVEGRLAVGAGKKAKGARYRPLEFGFSGAIGELRYSFYGKALGSYAAGTKQPFDTQTGPGVRACGGFVEREYNLKKAGDENLDVNRVLAHRRR
jgi:hypothetical protein